MKLCFFSVKHNFKKCRNVTDFADSKLTGNVLPIHTVANCGTDYFLLKIKILAKRKLEFTTKFAIV